MPELPKNPKEEGHRTKVQEYISRILENSDIRQEEEVKRIFKIKQFYDQAEKEAEIFEAVNVPS